MSGGKSKSQAKSVQVSTGSTFVDPTQVPFLNALRGEAAGIAGSQLGQINKVAGPLAGSLLQQGQGFQQQLGGIAQQGAGGGFDQAISSLLNFGGAGQLAGQELISASQNQALQGGDLISGAAANASSLLGPNPAIGGQIDALQAAIQQNLAATTGTIAGQASLVGGGQGGSRQALATGLAAQQAQTEFAGGASALLGQDFAGRQQLAPQLVQQQIAAGGILQQGGLAQQGLGLEAAGLLQQAQTQQQTQQLAALQSAGQLQLGETGARAGAAQAGLSQLGGLFELGVAPFQAQFGPLLNLAQIIGQPTVLSAQDASGSSESSSMSVSAGI